MTKGILVLLIISFIIVIISLTYIIIISKKNVLKISDKFGNTYQFFKYLLIYSSVFAIVLLIIHFYITSRIEKNEKINKYNEKINELIENSTFKTNSDTIITINSLNVFVPRNYISYIVEIEKERLKSFKFEFESRIYKFGYKGNYFALKEPSNVEKFSEYWLDNINLKSEYVELIENKDLLCNYEPCWISDYSRKESNTKNSIGTVIIWARENEIYLLEFFFYGEPAEYQIYKGLRNNIYKSIVFN